MNERFGGGFWLGNSPVKFEDPRPSVPKNYLSIKGPRKSTFPPSFQAESISAALLMTSADAGSQGFQLSDFGPDRMLFELSAWETNGDSTQRRTET